MNLSQISKSLEASYDKLSARPGAFQARLAAQNPKPAGVVARLEFLSGLLGELAGGHAPPESQSAPGHSSTRHSDRYEELRQVDPRAAGQYWKDHAEDICSERSA